MMMMMMMMMLPKISHPNFFAKPSY
jgi:hypothetical protein